MSDAPYQDPAKLYKIAVYATAVVFTVFILTVGSCTMHSNTFDAARSEAEALIEAEKAKNDVAKYQADQAETKAIEQMIKDGINPIAARCAVKGWIPNDSTCANVGQLLMK